MIKEQIFGSVTEFHAERAEYQRLIDEVNPPPRIPPSAEFILRRMLVEGKIRDLIDAELGSKLGLTDSGERDREMEKLWDQRMPDWEMFEPAQLTTQEVGFLELARLTESDQTPVHLASVACLKIRGHW